MVEVPQQDAEVEVITGKEKQYVIVLYNDDVNTFDHVIDCLVRICGHEVKQAEQCAHLVHYTGKCQVSDGTLKEMQKQCTALLDEKLSAKIELKN
jgi:ATP-dependent Clp protease adaptor protein ClpS